MTKKLEWYGKLRWSRQVCLSRSNIKRGLVIHFGLGRSHCCRQIYSDVALASVLGRKQIYRVVSSTTLVSRSQTNLQSGLVNPRQPSRSQSNSGLVNHFGLVSLLGRWLVYTSDAADDLTRREQPVVACGNQTSKKYSLTLPSLAT